MVGEVVLALIVAIIIGFCFKKVHSTFVDDRVYVKAYDGREYRVRNTPKKIETADALARLNEKVKILIQRLVEESDAEYKPAMLRLKSRYNPDTLSEGRIDKRFTSYTVNKGEEVVLCLRTRDEKDALHDSNLLFYVCLHELAHIASVGEDHNPEFHRNFRYILRKASEWNMFRRVTEKFHYCGMDVKGM